MPRYTGPVEAEARERWVGKQGVWTFILKQGTASTRVKVLDVRVNFGRVDLKLETNTLATIWASEETVEVP